MADFPAPGIEVADRETRATFFQLAGNGDDGDEMRIESSPDIAAFYESAQADDGRKAFF